MVNHTRLNQQDWLTLPLVGGIVLTAAGAVVAACWAEGLSQLLVVVPLSALLGMLLARTRFSEPIAFLLSSMYGLGFISLINASILSPGLGWRARYVELTERLGRWLEAVISGGVSDDNLVFVVSVSVLFWYLAHNAAWLTFRLDHLWRAVAPPALVLLVNNLYYHGPLRLEAFLLVYATLVLLLAVRSHLQARLRTWRYRGVSSARGVGLGFFRVGLIVALALLIVAWTLPTAEPADLKSFQDRWITGPLSDLSELWNRLFGSLEMQGSVTISYYGGETLPLGGPVNLSQTVVMYVQTEAPGKHRFYWRSRVHDEYDGQQWHAGKNARSRAPAGATLEVPQFWGQRQVLQRYTWASPALSGLVYVSQQPLQVGLSAEVDLILADELPVSTSAIVPSRPLRIGDYYDAISLVSQANPSRLRAAGLSYPAWVAERYLQLPSTVTQRTRDLALRIVNEAGAITPYNQALALEEWLRREIRYDESAFAFPPDRTDFVDWVLFEAQEGYCSYYASAMVVMLRSLGVPARVAAGFAQGEWDEEYQRYIVREHDAHTWVEVFFPGYGWVEFEPTSIRSTPQRDQPPPPTPSLAATQALMSTVEAVGSPTEGAAITSTPASTFSAATTPPSPGGTVRASSDAPDLSPVAIVGSFLFVLALLLVGLIPWVVERRWLGDKTQTAKAYALLYTYGRWLGVHPPLSETPSERGHRLTAAAPRAARSIWQITEWYNAEHYGQEPAAAPEAVRCAWERARRVLARRVLARWFRRGSG
jgi:transglutaminase-like putative cysteine protease